MAPSVSSRKSAIALIGNPGTGKSTILNGLVGEAVFSAGLAFGTGRTSQLQEHELDGVSYFDTPGLNDIDKRRQAGEELNKLLRQNISMKIIFVVYALNGRILPEDATTIRLVLDAITSANTTDRFGIIVNQAPQEWIDQLRASPLRERRVRSSYTGSRFTNHWCYIPFHSELQGKEEGQIKSDEISAFFDNVPETRPVGATVVDIDTDTFEEKLEQEKEKFQKMEEVLRIQLNAQNERMKMLEKLAQELSATVENERDVHAGERRELQAKQSELEGQIRDQVDKIVSANEEARDLRTNLGAVREEAVRNEERAREEMNELQRRLESDWDAHKSNEEAYRLAELSEQQRRETWTKVLEFISTVGPIVATAFAMA